MTLINIIGLGITLGEPLFRNLTLAISKGDRIGLVAANGRGKSTLLECIAGLIEANEGGATCARGLRIGYVTQNVPSAALEITLFDWVLAALPAEHAEYESWRVDVVLDELQVPYDLQHKLMHELSGGQKARLAMLALRLKQPNFYLLDEPTNHFDIEGQEALERELVEHDTSCVLVSHDRSFLRTVGNRFWWIKGKKLKEVESPEPFLNGEMGVL